MGAHRTQLFDEFANRHPVFQQHVHAAVDGDLDVGVHQVCRRDQAGEHLEVKVLRSGLGADAVAVGASQFADELL